MTGPEWQVLGTGDFDGDEHADILWQNVITGEVYIWFMNGLTLKAQGSVVPVAQEWLFEAIGDFDGDGKDDILWRHRATGQAYVWLMDGTTIKSQGPVG